jgi:hypothetical protein
MDGNSSFPNMSEAIEGATPLDAVRNHSSNERAMTARRTLDRDDDQLKAEGIARILPQSSLLAIRTSLSVASLPTQSRTARPSNASPLRQKMDLCTSASNQGVVFFSPCRAGPVGEELLLLAAFFTLSSEAFDFAPVSFCEWLFPPLEDLVD